MDNTNIDKRVSQADLAQAFTGKPSPKPSAVKKSGTKKPKSLIVSIVIFVIGIIALIAGLVVLIMKYTSGVGLQDGEFLVKAKEWVLEEDGTNCISETSEDDSVEAAETNCVDNSSVIWKFTEIGKGTLTTNGHKDDYDFIWAIEDNKLKIETSWLYDVVNDYEYKLNQNDKTLTLSDGEKEMVLVGHFAETQ